MIRAYVGDFSKGKTLSLTWHLLNEMYRGTRVITNYPIECDFAPPFRPMKHLKSECYTNGREFRHMIETEQNCIFGCDETAIYLPNEFWRGMNEELRFKFHLVEHFRTDIWYTVQEFSESVKRLRDLTNIVYQCDKYQFGIFDIFIHRKFKRQYFVGMPTEAKFELYYRGFGLIFPSEVRVAIKAYQRTYKFEGFQHGEFSKKRVEL